MNISHLAATLNSLLYNFFVFDNEVNDLSGLAGDLLQLGSNLGDKIVNRTFTEQNIYDLIGGTNDELANTLLGGENETAISTGFGL